MKKLLILTILTLFVLGNVGFAEKVKPVNQLKYPSLHEFKLPEIEKAQTENGIKLRLMKTEKLPVINMTIFIKGGDVYDPSAKVGLASLTAQLLRIGGAGELKGDDVDIFLDTNGISIGINSQNDFYTISLDCLLEKFDQALSILSKILMEPAFGDEKLEELKAQAASGISRRNDEPSPISHREFNKLIYGKNSPFAWDLEYEHLDNIAKQDIIDNYKKFFAPDNMLVGVTGPTDIDTIKSTFEKYFGNWRQKADILPYPQVQAQALDFKVGFVEKSTLTQSYLSLGHLGLKENFDEQAKIMVFNSIFSGSADARLFNRVRTKMGLTYDIGGGILTEQLFPGKTFFYTFTKSQSTIAAIKAIFDEINMIREKKVTEKELNDAKDSFVNSFIFKYSSPDRILFQELTREFYNLMEGYSEKLLENIKKVTADDVLEMAQKYLHPDQMVIFILGKEQDLDGKLEDLGKVKKIDISIKPPALKEKIPEATPEALEKGSKVLTELVGKKYSGYKTIKSLEIAADMKMSMMGQTMDMGSKSISLYPDKAFVEISIMGMKIPTIINGKKGVSRAMGQEKLLSEEQIVKQKFADLYDIFHAGDKYKIQYLWEKEIDGKQYHVLYLFDNQKNWVKFFVNKETGLIEIEEKVSDAPGMSGVSRTLNSDFKVIEGIPFAFKSETFINDKKVIDMTVKEVKVNQPVDASLFTIEQKN